MIPDYINEWLTIIEKMDNKTTYKLAWGRSILECIHFKKYIIKDNNIMICISDISEFVIKYYWDQYYFFRLKQAGSQSKNKANILDEVKKLILVYQEITKSKYPVWFDKAIIEIKKHSENKYNSSLNEVSRVLKSNPCKYFLNYGGKKSDIYACVGKHVIINEENAKLLNDYFSVLTMIINYKWSQLLEDYNTAPKINQKVIGVSKKDIDRGRLKKFIEYLILLTDNSPVDFYTGNLLEPNDISVDHVIPWSFMHSDDIWNLVLTTKSYNSSKSNSIPSEYVIEKLKQRNNQLLGLLDNKYRSEMKEAIENDYVDKFYNNCRYDFR